MLGEHRVDIVLCGHVHQSMVASVPVSGGHSAIIASAGTATSSRGRAGDRNSNLYNIVRVDDAIIDVEERRFDRERRQFVWLRQNPFSRLRI